MSSHRRLIGSKAKRKVYFPKNRSGGMAPPENNPAQGEGEEQTEETDPSSYWSAHEQVPAMHLKLPLLIDGHVTETSTKQLGTAQNIMKHVKETPLPELDRAMHVDFLLGPLHDGLSSRYSGLDASRPWIFYWCINALALLGEDVGRYNERAISSLKPLQHRDGGFGGGNGQTQHMASVYAVVLTLAITAHHASRDLPEAERFEVYTRSFSWINRQRLLQWIRRIKLPNGGFKVNEGGEEDVRAGYCALVTLALLGFDDEELRGDPSKGEKPLLDGVLDYFKRCQTWEGGIAAKQNSEAHGGYAFCVLAALCLLGEPREVLRTYLDLDRFISWLSARQYAPEGGFSGRTNKLVDGCYSTWVGGCWALVEAAANGIESVGLSFKAQVGSMWSRKALIRYILTCCQGPRGGLRDKPGIYPDFYHSNYVLIGLSAAQNYYYYDNDESESGGSARLGEGSPFRNAFCWKASRNVPKPSDPRDGRGGGWEEGLVPNEEDWVGLRRRPVRFDCPHDSRFPPSPALTLVCHHHHNLSSTSSAPPSSAVVVAGAMRPGLHRYVLPPALLLLHGLLLLPILVPYRPDNSSYPDSSLNFALHAAPYALPLGCLAFATVALSRFLTSLQLLPVSERRPVAILLFFIAIVEEIVRWVLVKCLSTMEGGGGGYGAKHPEPNHHGSLSRGHYGFPESSSVEVAPGIWEGIYLMGWVWSALESMHIWWLLRPTPAIEYTIPSGLGDPPVASRPQSYHSWRKEHAKKRSTDSTIRTIRGFPRRPNSFCVDMEQSSPDDRRFRPLSADNTFVQRGLLSGFDDRASSPELSRRSTREEDNDAGDEETSATDNDNDGIDSPLTPTIYRPAYHTAVPTQFTRPPANDEDDGQEESTPTQQKHNAGFFMPGSATSGSDYFGTREPAWTVSSPISPKRQVPELSRRLNTLTSDSETESALSGTQTPLLSSSIPLEPEQESLLDHTQIPSYGSTQNLPSTLLPPPLLDLQSNPPQAATAYRPTITSHPSYISVTTGDEAEDESDTQGKGGNFGRAYHPHPAFSSSYIHRHFPSSVLSNTTYGQLTPTNTPPRQLRPKLMMSQTMPIRKGKAKRPRSYPGIGQQPFPPIESIMNSENRCRMRMNGVEVDSVSFVLTLFWAIIAAFQHTGFGLWYVWFPTPIFEHTVQWWSIVFFFGVAFSKAIYVAQSGSGWITAYVGASLICHKFGDITIRNYLLTLSSRDGLLWPTTIGCAASSFVLYFVALILAFGASSESRLAIIIVEF
ncbi:hypothetical protein Dda_1329 [Drechslerella dactyloides]|uniref:Protein farnesyltransferase subunit beta n=1 Tax=Drechslerella dactyloides TaxID=74499 RepID=A0AAD6J2T6_DREDA|nr:hypothetical protein Dda_1329 [Drechslerella dactyloides]